MDSGTGGSSSAQTPKSIDELVPTAGTGVNDFVELCEFTCKYGYCPEGACTATNKGEQREQPDPTGVIGYPLEGESGAFTGLCAFACNLGYCPEDRCGPEEKPTYEGSVSPFVAAACTKGTGSGNLVGLCDYSCNWGFCPIHVCTCTATGPLNLPTPEQDPTITKASTTDGTLDYGLCTFACTRGYCPDPCKAAGADDLPGGVFTPGDGDDSGSTSYALLSLSSDYTRVHMQQDASDMVKSALSSQTCSAGKRETSSRDAFRRDVATGDIAKRTLASDACLLSTVTALLRDENVVSILLDLYRGNPIPGIISKITQIPAFATNLMSWTFLNGLSTASNFLSAVAPDMSTEEMIWVYYAMMDAASNYLDYHPADFLNFATARNGNMPDQCPNERDTYCESAICRSTDQNFCTGFLGNSGCRCNGPICSVKYSQTELMPFCHATNCIPVDPSTGLCMAEGKYNKCSCSGPVNVDTYTAFNQDKLNQVWIGTDYVGDPNAPVVKPDVTMCYKTGDSTHSARKDDTSKWHFMEQSVLDTTIDEFCEGNGVVSGDSGAGGANKYDMNHGTLNSVNIGFEYQQGATQTVEECKTKLKLLSADCGKQPHP